MKNANPVSWVARALAVLGAVAMMTAAGCKDEAPPAAPKTVADHFTIKIGDVPTHLQVAVYMTEMQRGLMGRTDLGPDDGMIFIYEKPQRMSFWMHDTPTALDIGFFDGSGELREVFTMKPFDETTVSSYSQSLRFAVEMKEGWYAQHQVKPGAKLDTGALAAALKARGFNPTRYGLALP